MRQDYTDIIVVLDRSGSMQSVRNDTIGGFNKFLEDQKAVPGTATLTLTQFDHEYEIVHNAIPIGDVKPLSNDTYIPRGNTALLDAIGRTINTAGKRLADLPENDRPGKVVFVILTDGEENSSHEFSRDQVFKMITEQREKYAWEFVFLGANQDAIKAGASLGVSASNSLTYASNAQGTQSAFTSTSSNIRGFRMGAAANAGYSKADRDAQKAAGASH